MGLFKPKMSSSDWQQVKMMMKQSEDCAKLIDSTVNPDVFFERLNFMLDLTLTLQRYEKYKVFRGGTPSVLYNQMVTNLWEIVDGFITRAYNKQREKAAKLKTDNGKQKSNAKFAAELKSAFDHANSFWPGHKNQVHYEGPLFTDKNYQRVLSICKEFAM